MRSRVRVFVALAIFFASGAAALIFETSWFHQAGLAFGSSVWASSLVLAGFMAGLAIGGALAWRYGDRLRAPLRTYGAIELVVAATGVALVYLLPELGRALAPLLSTFGDAPAVLHALRLLLAFGLLLVPSTAMGMTLPLLARTLTAWDENFGRVLGRLYGANTLGAVSGVLGAELLLVPALGIRATALAAGAASALAGFAALGLARRHDATARDAPPPSVSLGACGPLLGAAFLAGFALLGLEVVWLRFLLLFLNGSSLAFAVILALVLIGIAAGGFLAAAWLSREPAAGRYAGAVALAASVLGIAGYRVFPWFGNRVNIGGEQHAALIAVLSGPLVLGTSLASGMLFTLIGARLQSSLGSENRATASLAFVNTVGAALGPLIAGFVLLPRLGMERSLIVLFASYAVAAALLFHRSEARRSIMLASAAACLAAFAWFPYGEMSSRYLSASLRRWASTPDDRVLELREGSAATVSYLEHRGLGERRHLQLVTNAFSMSSTAFWVRRYAKLYVYWPVAVRPRVNSALVIGYGVGNTLRALTDTRELESIDVVDISRDIVELGARVSDEGKRGLADRRVSVHIEDGRWFLQGARRRWDLITGEPPPHHIAGVVNLYSREYFEFVRERLNDGGVVTYWLHAELMSGPTARGILRAFCDAFEDCSLWHGSGVDFMLVGTKGAAGPVDEARFSAQWLDPRILPELVALGIERPEQLGALFIADARHLRELLRDDEPIVDDEPHRLRGAPRGFVEGLTESWRDTTAAAERFRSSELISRLWPPELRKKTLDYFDAQHLLNQLLFPAPLPGFQKDLATVHAALNGPKLELPVLLLLGTDPDWQRAAARLERKQPGHPEALRHLAVGSLARRDFARSAEQFRLLLGTQYDRQARALLAYLEREGWLEAALSPPKSAEQR